MTVRMPSNQQPQHMEELPHYVLARIGSFADVHSLLALFSSSHTLYAFLRSSENMLFRVLVFRDFPDNVTDVENLAYQHFWLEHYMSTSAKMRARAVLRRRGRALLEQYHQVFSQKQTILWTNVGSST